MGGLGNQIFQIFTTISYAIKTRNTFKFSGVKYVGGGMTTIRNTYWESFFSRLKNFTTCKLPQLKCIREENFTFNELPLHEMEKNGAIIFGYFQSYKYFEENYEMISRLIGLEEMKNVLCKKIHYDKIFLNNTISMHFRIGDYKKIQHVHPLMTKEYYHRSITHILSSYKHSTTKLTILYLCEKVDISDVNEVILYLSKCFPELNFVYGENNLEDWEQMLLMSCCHHNIIANSSFSWWSAYFNSWEDKMVCYPSVWFGQGVIHNTNDLCPPTWTKILA